MFCYGKGVVLALLVFVCYSDALLFSKTQDCLVSEWSDWSETFGFGTQARERTILRFETYGGKPCPKDLFETQKTNFCNDWNKWTSCDVTSGEGTRTRYRTCNEIEVAICQSTDLPETTSPTPISYSTTTPMPNSTYSQTNSTTESTTQPTPVTSYTHSSQPTPVTSNPNILPIYGRDLEDAIKIGSRVVRGKDWAWGNQDGTPPTPGTVTRWYNNDKSSKQVMVKWDSGLETNYRNGLFGRLYDLYLLKV